MKDVAAWEATVAQARSLPSLNPAEVAAAGRGLPRTFVVRLVTSDGLGAASSGAELTIICREVLRLLPGRRLVARVETAVGVAVLKLFLGAGAARYCARETRGCARLTNAGVRTPALLGRLRDAGSGARGLLFEFLDHARPLDARDEEGVLAAVAELARLHQAGSRHGDLHLENFLRRPDGSVSLVDGDGVAAPRIHRLMHRPLGLRASIENLAVLCAQRPPLADEGLADVYRAYAAGRGWSSNPRTSPSGLALAVARQRRRRVRRYLGKTQRECTEYLVERYMRRRVLALRSEWSPDLAAFAADPEAAMAAGTIIKAGNSATVVRVTVGGRRCIIKRYNLKNAWQAARRALKPVPRFRLAWLNGQRLNFLEIPTARPLVLVERRFGWLRGVAYLVMEDVGEHDLGTEMLRAGLSQHRLEQVVSLFRAMAAAGLSHGDTKASNFLVTASAVAVVDLDAMGEDAAGSRRDVARFLSNFDPQPEIRARFRAAFQSAGLVVPAE